MHDLITCESKVQVVVALGRHEVLTNDTWHVLLQSENVLELGGITNNFYLCIVLFWVGRYNKTLNDWPLGKQWVLFPSTSMFPSASPRGTLRVSGKQNSLFPLGPVIKCLLFSSFSRCSSIFVGAQTLDHFSRQIFDKLVKLVFIITNPGLVHRGINLLSGRFSNPILVIQGIWSFSTV